MFTNLTRALLSGVLGALAAGCGSGGLTGNLTTGQPGGTFSVAQRETAEAGLRFANPAGPTTVPGATVQPCRTEVPTISVQVQGGTPLANSSPSSLQPTFSASELATHEAAMLYSQPGTGTSPEAGNKTPTPTLPICPTPAMPQQGIPLPATILAPAATP